MPDVTLDPARQQKAKEYARIRHRLTLLDLGIAVALTLIWLFSGISQAVAATVRAWNSNEYLVVALYMLVFGAVYFVVDLPLAYYSGFTLQHRYGMSTQTRRDFLLDMAKGLALSGLLGLVLIEIVYLLLRLAPETWWLWTAAVLLFVTVVLANLAPIVILPLFFKLTPLDNPDLVQRLTALAETAHTRVSGVYSINFSSKTTAANAALMGLGNTRRIVLGDTLLSGFSPDEIETVLAHELGHQVNRDIPLGILVQTALTLAGLWLASIGMQWGVRWLGFDGVADVAAFPLFAAVMGAFGVVTMPVGNAFTRWRERLADRYALVSTSKPEAFIGAMTRLANQNLSELDPEPWVEFILYSHPSIGKRIAMANAYADGGMGVNWMDESHSNPGVGRNAAQ